MSESPIIVEAASAGHGAAALYATATSPPASPPDGHAAFHDLGVAPGIVSWQLVQHKANMVAPMHRTDTVDLDLVLQGGTQLGLDDGLHPLGPGDCVVITGVDHFWRTGPAGCLLSVTSIGTEPGRA